jgi:hypothetical protein
VSISESGNTVSSSSWAANSRFRRPRQRRRVQTIILYLADHQPSSDYQPCSDYHLHRPDSWRNRKRARSCRSPSLDQPPQRALSSPPLPPRPATFHHCPFLLPSLLLSALSSSTMPGVFAAEGKYILADTVMENVRLPEDPASFVDVDSVSLRLTTNNVLCLAHWVWIRSFGDTPRKFLAEGWQD